MIDPKIIVAAGEAASRTAESFSKTFDEDKLIKEALELYGKDVDLAPLREAMNLVIRAEDLSTDDKVARLLDIFKASQQAKTAEIEAKAKCTEPIIRHRWTILKIAGEIAADLFTGLLAEIPFGIARHNRRKSEDSNAA